MCILSLSDHPILDSRPILAELAHFGLIQFSGADAGQFLHGQLSCDVNSLLTGQARYGSYNTPQGRMLASVLLWRDDAGYVMQLPRSLCDPIGKRLSKYILRTKVKIAGISENKVLLGLAGTQAEAVLRPLFDSIPSAPLELAGGPNGVLLRLDGGRFEIIAAPSRAAELREELAKDAVLASQARWDWTNIHAGIPYITPATQEQFVPQMANLDRIGGVSFSKGCYPGQEIVARMHYLGRLKQRMYLANIASELAPQPGDKLYSAAMADQASGMIVSAAPSPAGGHDVLAVIQTASAAADDVRWPTPAGAKLTLLPLPYEV